MDRRTALKTSLVTLACSSLLSGQQRTLFHTGWVPTDIPKGVPASKYAARIIGAGSNKVVRLFKYWEIANEAPFQPHFQKIGDCVSQATALAVETLSAKQVLNLGDTWCGKVSTEAIYAGSRVEIGKGALGNQEGSTGVWAAEFLSKYGVLVRRKYKSVDLSKYDPDLATRWARPRAGVPDILEPVARQHLVHKTVNIDGGWTQACDLVSLGMPVVICSGIGFDDTCDRDGFLSPGPEWWHSMLLWAIDTKSSRPGGCIANSWGLNWLKQRQHKYGTPPGCFWADAKVINKMLGYGDSHAIGDLEGFRDLSSVLHPPGRGTGSRSVLSRQWGGTSRSSAYQSGVCL